MATSKKTTAKPVVKATQKTSSKSAIPAKKVAPIKKAAPTKVVAKVVPKKVVNPVAKPAPKKVAVVKKAAPVKKAIVAKKTVPVKKPAAVKKVAPVKAVQKVAVQPAKVINKPVAVKVSPKKAVQPAIKIMAKKKEIPAVEAKEVAATKAVAAVKAKDIKVPAPKPVVMPKIITKTVRKYEPDFTKSVLDKTERDLGAPSQRYSDNELIEFKELILRKLEAAKKELSFLHGLITRKDGLGGDEGDNRYMTMEDGSLSMEREQLSQMASRQITFIDHLEKAIMRIENKTYGICRVTGKLIDKARLRAVPHATLSIEAKMGSVK